MVQRKGEWLELIMPRSVQAQDDGVHAYLMNDLGMPENMIRRMQNHKEIIRIGDRLRLRFFASRPFGFEPQWMDVHILYEDDFCLVAYKPPGMPVHPSSKEAAGTLANGIAFHYLSTGQEAAVRHIHRLDDWTSGPVLYAKNEYAQMKLDEDMRNKRIARIYLAIVRGMPRNKQGVIHAPIGRDRHQSGKRRVSQTGDPAITHYEVIEQLRDAAVLRLQLETGRTHQIRVHLSHIGHPIIGDALYGGSEEYLPRQALHGECLRFRHPFSGESIEVTAEIPADIQAVLNRLTD
jgi:23S rRNA pseudouridine1911/1915/1917 synthase